MSIMNSIFINLFPLIVKKDPFLANLDGVKDKYECEFPTRSHLKGLKLKQTMYKKRKILALLPEQYNIDVEVIFFHGGGYTSQTNSYHWSLFTRLTRMCKVIFYIVDYPLAPAAHSGEALEYVYGYYKEHLQHANGKKLILMGDSAGGGLALSLAMKLRDEAEILPEKIILLSPFLDCKGSDPRQKELEKQDVLISIKGLRRAGDAYAGNLSIEDWRISPIYGDVSKLSPISMYTSDRDVLHADSLRLKEKLENNEGPYSYHFKSGVMHDWMLYTFVPEAKSTIDEIADEITAIG